MFWMLVVAAVVVLLVWACPAINGTAFKKKWPAISDDEFVKRCAPGTRRETALKVRRIVSKQLGLPYDHIYPEQNFVNDLECY
jgi:hypothetical protein